MREDAPDWIQLSNWDDISSRDTHKSPVSIVDVQKIQKETDFLCLATPFFAVYLCFEELEKPDKLD